MSVIREEDFIQSIADAFQFISYYHPKDFVQAMSEAWRREENPAAKDAIAQMKDGAVLINTSRGCNVDENALLDALNSGKLRAAGLDVYAEEPTHNEALLSHPAVSCTPHIGAATVEAQKRIGFEVVDIITGFFR